MKTCLQCHHAWDSAVWRCDACGFTPGEMDGLTAFSQVSPQGGFNPRDFETLYRIEDRHFWFRARNRLIQWALRRYFSDARDFLEVGCGTGYVLAGIRKAMPRLNLYGSELYVEGLAYARQRLPEAVFCQMDARHMPFDAEFDVIGAFDVLEHIAEDGAVLQQLHRALHKKRGGLLLTVPQHPFLWSQADERAQHVRRYRAGELREKVEQAGFQVLRITSFVTLPFPAMLLSRLLPKPRAQEIELDVPAWQNACLGWLLRVEAGMIQSGVSLPFGGSLLLVGQVKV